MTDTPIAKAARSYQDRGWAVIPISPGQKSPIQNGWQNGGISAESIDTFFNDPNRSHNVSVLLGEHSNNLVDVDIDDELALQIADEFLPETGYMTGRKSKPASHRFYQAELSNYLTFKHPNTQDVFVEVRGDKRQTVMPPSVHPSGEYYHIDADGTPTAYVEDDIIIPAAYLSVTTLMIKTWPGSGGRNDYSMAAAALFVKSGLPEDTAVKIMRIAAEYADDPEVKKRVSVVVDTYEKYNNNEDITGQSAINDAMTQPVASAIKKWLGKVAGHAAGSKRGGGGVGLPGEPDDTDLITEIYDRNNSVLKFVPEWNKWLWFDGIRWIGRDRTQAVRAVWRLGKRYRELSETAALRADRERYIKIAKQLLGVGSSNSFAAAMENDTRFYTSPDEFDANPILLGTPIGVVDLSTSVIRKSRPEDFVTKSIRYVPAPGETTFTDQYILDMANGNTDLAEYIWKALAYSITGEAFERCFFILSGTGGNGKSMLFRCVSDMLADYVQTISPAILMKPDDDRPMPSLAKLHGTRFVYTTESNEMTRFNAGLLKRLSGGDTMSVRDLYESDINLVPTFKLWIATNNEPEISAIDEALWDRVRLIPMLHKFAKNREEAAEAGVTWMKDTDVLESVRVEAPAVLWKLIHMVPGLESTGMKSPDAVTDATAEYRQTQDTVGDFISELLIVTGDENDTASTSATYEAYVHMCKGVRTQPVSNVAFGRELMSRGIGRKQDGGRAYTGVKLVGMHRADFGFSPMPD